jgi:hypothetical protein
VTARAYLVGQLAGEMAAADIPLSRAVSQSQLDALMAGDEDPLPVVIEVAPGKSSRGWNYTEAALQKLVGHVQEKSLNGIMGHQTEDSLATEFRPPVTHWVGATWQDGKAYFRGVVDKTAPDLKRWIKAGRVTQPSIFTRPTLKRNEVVDLEPLSIDWAPLDRAGMSTAKIVAWGEMSDSDKPPATNTQEGNRRMERTEVLNLAGGLSDPLSVLADLAERFQGAWREINVRQKLVSDLQEQTGKTPPELLAFFSGLMAAQKLDAATLASIAEMTSNQDPKDGVDKLRLERDALRTENARLRQANIEPLLRQAAGELRVPEGAMLLVLERGTPLAVEKQITDLEGAKGVVGEIKQHPAVKAVLDMQGTPTINPGTHSPSSGGHTSGPDMSVFAMTVSAVG